VNQRKKIFSIGAGLTIGSGLGILILFGLGGWDALARLAGSPQGVFKNSDRALDFTLDTLDGNRVRLSDLQGKIVLLNFWATWCVPCKEEMPILEDRSRRYGPGLVVLAINFAEPQDVVKGYVDEMGLTFDVLLDPRAIVQEMYKVRGYPTSVFIDAEGMIRTQHIGVMTEKQLDGYLAKVGLLPQAEQQGGS
jgi:thiol-disulfide isomerase/thioredoxin